MTESPITSVHTTLDPERNELFEQRARLLGHIWSVMMTSHEHRQRRFEILEHLFNPAFRHGSIALYFNSMSEPVAYFVWAFLAPDVEERFMNSGQFDLHLSEWNEGNQLWIIDCAVKPGYFASIARCHLLDRFPDSGSVRYYRRRGDNIVCKEVFKDGFQRLVSLL